MVVFDRLLLRPRLDHQVRTPRAPDRLPFPRDLWRRTFSSGTHRRVLPLRLGGTNRAPVVPHRSFSGVPNVVFGVVEVGVAVDEGGDLELDGGLLAEIFRKITNDETFRKKISVKKRQKKSHVEDSQDDPETLPPSLLAGTRGTGDGVLLSRTTPKDFEVSLASEILERKQDCTHCRGILYEGCRG